MRKHLKSDPPEGAATPPEVENKARADTSKYVPNAREAAGLKRTEERRATRPVFPPFKEATSSDGTAKVSIQHEDEIAAVALQLDALGLSSNSELTSVMKSVFNFTTRDGKIDASAATEAMRLAVGFEPRNTTEGVLAIQMSAVHLATMEAARRLSRTNSTAESVSVTTKALNNLARTFAMQAETMKKLKGGGPQHVVVEHKHYHLHQAPEGGGAEPETEHQPHERGISERQAVLSHLEADSLPLPGAGSKGLERVSLSRG